MDSPVVLNTDTSPNELPIDMVRSGTVSYLLMNSLAVAPLSLRSRFMMPLPVRYPFSSDSMSSAM